MFQRSTICKKKDQFILVWDPDQTSILETIFRIRSIDTVDAETILQRRKRD